MLQGTLLTESLRVGAEIAVPGLEITRLGRRDVLVVTADGTRDPHRGATADQPPVWTFVEFQAPDAVAGALARALADSLESETGWYAGPPAPPTTNSTGVLEAGAQVPPTAPGSNSTHSSRWSTIATCHPASRQARA